MMKLSKLYWRPLLVNCQRFPVNPPHQPIQLVPQQKEKWTVPCLNTKKEAERQMSVKANSFKVPNIERNFRQSQPKSYLCHYELAEALPQGKMNEDQQSGCVLIQESLMHNHHCHSKKHMSVAYTLTEQILAPIQLYQNRHY